MSDMEDNDTQDAPEKGSWKVAFKRGVGGLTEGLQTGAIIGGGLCGVAFLADALLPGAPVTSFLFHGAEHPLMASLGLVSAHSVGAGLFECACEAHDGLKGDTEEHDHIRDTAEKVDQKFLEIEGIAPAQNKAQAYQFDRPQPETSPVIKALVAQGATPQQAEAWRDRLAAQQLAQLTQDRTV